jgi:hypothetical protein
VRQRLSELVTAVSDAAAAATTDPYEPTGYRVLATEPFEADPSVAADELAWPDELPPPELDDCIAITGAGAATLTALLDAATEITRWTVGDAEVALSIRPMLPHEDSC